MPNRAGEQHTFEAAPADLRALLARAPAGEAGGVLNFLADLDADYCSNFGDQWQRFRAVQIDSISGSTESRDRFYGETGLASGWLSGKVVLDAGCGAGRFAEVALAAGACVVAVDLSEAVFACQATLSRFPRERFLVLRADIFDLPLKPDSFDLVYSLGVLHHTPDPPGAVRALARYVRPGGRLATWFYERRAYDVIGPKFLMRHLTRRLPNGANLALAKIMVTAFFPLGWLFARLGELGRLLGFFLPYTPRHKARPGRLREQWLYSVLDTYDWYGPTYTRPQRQDDVIGAMAASGLIDARRLPARGMAIVADRPR